MPTKSPARRTAGTAAALVAEARRLDGRPERAAAAAVRWVKLPDREVAAAAGAVWAQLAHPADRRQVLKTFFHARHPAALELLDLGMRDSDPRVRSWAAEFLGGLAFRDFRQDAELYPRWRDAQRGLSVEAVLRANARDFVARLRRALPHELRDESRMLIEYIRAVNVPFLAEAGLLDLLAEWISSERPEVAENALRVLSHFPVDRARLHSMLADWIREGAESTALAVLRHLPGFPLDGEFCRRTLLPAMEGRPGLRAAVLRALGRPGAAWAVDVISPRLADPSDDVVLAAAEALGQIGDRRAVPALVAALHADTSGGRRYGIAYFGLEPLTGVEYNPAHDAEWWGGWLAEFGVAHGGAKKAAKAKRGKAPAKKKAGRKKVRAKKAAPKPPARKKAARGKQRRRRKTRK
ncbi:MAG: HEAT repeat domain-containing protein [Planctomycetes bacterium]|nr:HEAT repeat domain-containing protein [Planctomycetota bacterium]